MVHLESAQSSILINESKLAFLHRFDQGACLADDMGLGKTLQSIAWVLWLRSRLVHYRIRDER